MAQPWCAPSSGKKVRKNPWGRTKAHPTNGALERLAFSQAHSTAQRTAKPHKSKKEGRAREQLPPMCRRGEGKRGEKGGEVG